MTEILVNKDADFSMQDSITLLEIPSQQKRTEIIYLTHFNSEFINLCHTYLSFWKRIWQGFGSKLIAKT